MHVAVADNFLAAQLLRFLTLLFAVSLPASANAQGLSFDDFPTAYRYFGAPAAPDLSTARAKQYRSLLLRDSALGPNFAGIYRFVPVGVGSATISVAIVNMETGKVIFPKTLPLITWMDWPEAAYGPEFRIASRLLIVRGRVGSEKSPLGIYYFEWSGNEFVRLRFERLRPK